MKQQWNKQVHPMDPEGASEVKRAVLIVNKTFGLPRRVETPNLQKPKKLRQKTIRASQNVFDARAHRSMNQ